jgi:hypothetical protein
LPCDESAKACVRPGEPHAGALKRTRLAGAAAVTPVLAARHAARPLHEQAIRVAARRGGRADRSPVADVSVAVVMARLMRRSAGRAASDQRH